MKYLLTSKRRNSKGQRGDQYKYYYDAEKDDIICKDYSYSLKLITGMGPYTFSGVCPNFILELLEDECPIERPIHIDKNAKKFICNKIMKDSL